MENLLKCIKLRIEEQYFGSHIRISKTHADKTILEQAKFDFNGFYVNVCKYLNDHFDFNDTNPLKQIQPLSLTQNFYYDDIVKAATALGLENKISIDESPPPLTLIESPIFIRGKVATLVIILNEHNL